MRKFASPLLAASLAFGMALTAFAASATAQGAVTEAQYYGGRNQEWQQYPERNWRNQMERRRQYREDRPRWRSDRKERPAYRGGNRHVRWCYERYRSYRAYDNTFQPNHGPRRQCYSPFI